MTASMNTLVQSSHEERQLLLRRLQNGTDETLSNISSEQHRVWLLRQLDVPTHIFSAVEIDGRLDVLALEQSARDVVARHEVLRSTFVDLGRRPARIVARSAKINLRLANAEGLSQEQYRAELNRLAELDSHEPFDLQCAPLVRLTLVRHSETRHALLVAMHELVADQSSLTIFIQELLQLYESRVSGQPLSLPDWPRHFSVLTDLEHEWLKTSECEDQLSYWRETLADAPVLHLPTDYTRPAMKTHRVAVERCALSEETLRSLEGVCESEGATLKVLFLAAFNTLLSWYSRQDDLVVGISVDRPTEGGIGPLTNEVTIRTDLSADPPFAELLRRVGDQVNAAQLRQRIPFAKLLESLTLERDLSRTPIFQAKFSLRDQPFRDLNLRSLKLIPLELINGNGLFDVTLSVVLGDDASLELEYNVDLFRPDTVKRMLSHMVLILDAVAADHLMPLSRLTVLPDAEQRLLAIEWNRTEQPFPHDKCMHEIFEEQAARIPDAMAVVSGETQFTYKELDEKANRLADYLIRRGIESEQRVGVCLDKSPLTIVSLLAVLKAGGAYIPIEPEWPQERIAFILNDGGAQAVLTRREFLGRLPASFNNVLVLDDESFDDGLAATTQPRRRALPENLAYVIYTSGSTGKPKGVAVTHQSVINNLTWRQSMWPLSTDDRILQNNSFTFDPSVWGTFWPLMNGACVILPPATKHFDSVALARLLQQERVLIYGGAPSMHSVLVEESATLSRTALRYVFSGGESLDPELQNRLHESTPASVYSVYGPTEATIDCTYWLCPRDQEPKVAPIGEPIANTQIYLLNKHLELVPVGVEGEIFIGGLGLARGYVGHFSLTSEKFIPDPFSPIPGARIYRTGDLGRRRPDGVIEFVGRTDEQVKVRGFRIELSEIERTIILHEKVNEAAVIVTRGPSGDPRLTAYLGLGEKPDALSVEEITAFLKERLPVFMIPELFVMLDVLPKTSGGKIDRRGLPQPRDTQSASAGLLIEPRTALESEISKLVENVLGLDRMSVDADFFSLGCNSLLMARIASRLSSAYQLNLPNAQIFVDPTVAGLARLIERYQNPDQAGARQTWTLEQLQAEAVLDPSITTEGLPHADYFSPRNVFLTGVTGYLGAFLLEQLLTDTTADVYCLVRASDTAQANQRIEETLEKYRINVAAHRERIHPVVGDLAKPLLGLSEYEFAKLGETVDVIYHSGCLVNFVYPYSALKAPNVSGTHEVIRLACLSKVKAVHYTSTVDVFVATQTLRPFLENEDVLDNPREIPDSYGRSKWVSEKMLVNARSRGVPVCVYRPGLIMGHTKTGATQTNDYLLVALKGFIDLGLLPEPRIMMDFVSVDYVAKSIAALSRRPDSIGKYFHIWNPNGVDMGKAYEWIRSFGYNLDIVSYSVMRERVLTIDSSNALYPFLAGFRARQEAPAPHLSHDPAVVEATDVYAECGNTIRGLEGTGIECPPLTEEMAHLTLSYLTSIGFLPHPAQ